MSSDSTDLDAMRWSEEIRRKIARRTGHQRAGQLLHPFSDHHLIASNFLSSVLVTGVEIEFDKNRCDEIAKKAPMLAGGRADASQLHPQANVVHGRDACASSLALLLDDRKHGTANCAEHGVSLERLDDEAVHAARHPRSMP
jgi:hypothetical protein